MTTFIGGAVEHPGARTISGPRLGRGALRDSESAATPESFAVAACSVDPASSTRVRAALDGARKRQRPGQRFADL